jgi:hypothetical protein
LIKRIAAKKMKIVISKSREKFNFSKIGIKIVTMYSTKYFSNKLQVTITAKEYVISLKSLLKYINFNISSNFLIIINCRLFQKYNNNTCIPSYCSFFGIIRGCQSFDLTQFLNIARLFCGKVYSYSIGLI